METQKNEVKIGPIRYQIRIKKHPRLGDTPLAGKICYARKRITLREALTQEDLDVTLLHEIIHGIAEDRELKVGQNEREVDQLARGLYAVFQENPHIFHMGFHM